MNFIKSKYTVITLVVLSIALCFFPVLSAEITTGEAYTSVIRGYNLLEFSAFGIVFLIAPMLVPTILYGCQSRAAKELELIALLLGSNVCYAHSIHNAWRWLNEIGAALIEVKMSMLLYPIAFIALCIVAIIQNYCKNNAGKVLSIY